MPDLSHTAAYRIVHGAVRDALNGHKTWRVPVALPESVAKRAAGTLLAQAGALAEANPPREGEVSDKCLVREPSHVTSRRLPPFLNVIRSRIGRLTHEARVAGNREREAALIDALRMIDRERNAYATRTGAK